MQETPGAQEPIQASKMSLFSKMATLFAAPGEVFGQIKSTPVKTAHWLVPTIFLVLIGSVFTVTMYSNSNIMSQQLEQVEKRVDRMIEKGTIPAEAREQVIEQQTSMMESPLFIVSGIAGYSFVLFAMLFGVTLVWWLVGKWIIKARVGYGKVLEVAGLSSTINILGAIVSVLLLMVFETAYATPSLALAVIENYDPENVAHSLMASVNGFTLWYLGVTAVGLGKVYEVATGKVAVWVFVLWALYSVGVAMVGIPYF